MNRYLFLAQLALGMCAPSLEAANRPNVVFILADDLGYGDLGCYGQSKIKTPFLDQLAKEGMRLTQHYSGNAVCAPSRCVLMTGMHPGHAVVRNNREAKPEGQFPLPAGTLTLARVLKEQGYVTGAFGKWGLGGPGSSGDPLAQGFDRFYGYNCQRVAHNYYPTYLWDNDKRVELRNKAFPAHAKLNPEEDVNSPKTFERFSDKDYAPDLITEQALGFVDANKDRPFLLYWPTVVPHLALQVPENSLAEYEGKWPETPYPGGKGYLPHRQPRAAYAAMITRMDRDIGRLMEKLKQLGLEKNTLVVFTSDNGPLYDRLGGTDCEFFNSHGGLRGRKGSLYEGGVRVPCIARWPGVIPAGSVSDRVTGFEDWLPTILELARCQPVSTRIDGISFAPTLRGQTQDERPFLYREFSGYGGQQSIRVGKWKAVRQNLGKLKTGADINTELFELESDPAENRNRANEQPYFLRKLESLMRDQHLPSRNFPMKILDDVP